MSRKPLPLFEGILFFSCFSLLKHINKHWQNTTLIRFQLPHQSTVSITLFRSLSPTAYWFPTSITLFGYIYKHLCYNSIMNESNVFPATSFFFFYFVFLTNLQVISWYQSFWSSPFLTYGRSGLIFGSSTDLLPVYNYGGFHYSVTSQVPHDES